MGIKKAITVNNILMVVNAYIYIICILPGFILVVLLSAIELHRLQ
jgi:hypothetical protein